MGTIIQHIKSIKTELIIWLIALIYLAIINPYAEQHLDLCIFKIIGIDFCPGCGIGKSISMIFHVDFINSFNTHPLGIFALVVISKRIFDLSINNFNLKNNEVLNG